MKLDAQRIVIVRLGAIGDVVNCLPFVCRLRDGAPHAHIAWIVGRKSYPVVKGHRAIDEFFVFDVDRPAGWPAFVRVLRAQKFDLAVVLQRTFKAGLVARFSGAPRRLGFDRARCTEGSQVLTNLKIAPNPSPGVTVAQYLEFADWLELPAAAPRWDLPSEPFQGSDKDELRIVLHVGASWESKLWPREHWAVLARRLVVEIGARVHVTGGKEDRPLAEDIRARAGVDLAIHAGELSLPGTAGLLRTARIVVGADSGPLHMAVAVGTPVIGLYGATDPRRSAPFGQPLGVLQNPTPCSPCRRRRCHVAGQPCMSGLTVDVVLARVRALLADARA